ncbi:DUF6717 family protein [Pedobacter nyackensis]|uniref:Uncharacterized protein n=1 Tax=Pedobacter nyackensis TaxID=475255 RepID=A0A1W2DAP5_9SPHI|nr:DUF6717 family protein [Pedobacter nyackensis]SMC94525.1 hypothetical protein SAMN04488101_10694 [Pedobacter nyackensis]
MKETFRFYKTAAGKWYIDLPEWGGNTEDLEMVQGADTMLDKVSGHTNECYLEMSDEPFDGADRIKLVQDLTNTLGGGNYVMETYKGELVNHDMWLCQVTVDVFHDLPRAIYVSYPNSK